MDYNFTTLEILTTIANWPLEPFTLEELDLLLKHFLPEDNYINDNPSYTYGENDIQSFILHILTD